MESGLRNARSSNNSTMLPACGYAAVVAFQSSRIWRRSAGGSTFRSRTLRLDFVDSVFIGLAFLFDDAVEQSLQVRYQALRRCLFKNISAVSQHAAQSAGGLVHGQVQIHLDGFRR